MKRKITLFTTSYEFLFFTICINLYRNNLLVSSFTTTTSKSVSSIFALPSPNENYKVHHRLPFVQSNHNNRIVIQARKKDKFDDDEEEFDEFVINGEDEADDIDYEYEEDEEEEDEEEDYEDDDYDYEEEEEETEMEEEETEEEVEDELSKQQQKILTKLSEMDIELKLEETEDENRNTSDYVGLALKDEPSISPKEEKELFIDVTAFSEEKLQEMLEKYSDVAKQKTLKDIEEEYPEDGDEIYEKISGGGNVSRADFMEFEEEYNTLLQNQRELIESRTDPNVRGGLFKNIDIIIDDEYILSSNNTDLSDEVKQEIFNVDYWAECDEDPNMLSIREQRRRLIYDLDYNVTNLFLASVKVNPDAPYLLENWLLALRNQTKYEYVRKNHFNFTWDDVDQANVTELQQYYINAGFDSIPTANDTEQNHMVEWDENPLSFEEEQMLAFEKFMEEVYQEDDDICLDDEDFMPHDNPAGPDYIGNPNSNASTAIDPLLKDVQEFEEKYEHMSQDWRDQYVRRYQYQIEENNDEDFRGHLVIACSPSEDDIDMAEKITLRMEKSFGAQVFVETRVIGHAKLEDNLYEIWLESWDIDLLFSKRRAVFNAREWEGPKDITDEYIEELVEKVEFLISDDARYSYRA